MFGEEPETNLNAIRLWESLSKTSRTAGRCGNYARMANHEVKHLWAPPVNGSGGCVREGTCGGGL